MEKLNKDGEKVAHTKEGPKITKNQVDSAIRRLKNKQASNLSYLTANIKPIP